MKVKDIFLRIKFSPTKYPLEIQHQLDILDMLVGPEEEEEIREIVAQHPDIPEFQLELAYLFADLEKPLQYINAIDQLLDSYPDNVAIKGAFARAHYTNFSIPDQRDGLQKLFAPEIESIFGDGSLSNAISDREFRILLLSLNHYYSEVGEIEKCHHIFELANQLQQKELSATIAFQIQRKELPVGGLNFEKEENVEFWVSNTFAKFADFEIKQHPGNELFYLLLNKSADTLTSEEINQLSTFENKANLQHDILWLLKAGLVRTMNHMGETGQDYFVNALFLTAHFELSELTGLILQLLTGLPEDIMEELFGDFADLILIPPLRKIGSSSLDGFYEMLIHTEKDEYGDEDDDEFEPPLLPEFFNNYWHSKSYVVEALANIAVEDGPTREEAKNLLLALWNHYDQHDHEMLGWTAQSIQSNGVEGFDNAIKIAYDENKINQLAHGSYEEFSDNSQPPFKNYDLLDQYSNLADFYQVFSVIKERLGHPPKIDIEEQIDLAIDNYLDDIQKTKEYLASQGFDDDDLDDLDDDNAFYTEVDDLEDDDNDDSLLPFAQKAIEKKSRKIGRNDPCPCGSGKKYKKCCLNKN
jgi:hypothetical protein